MPTTDHGERFPILFTGGNRSLAIVGLRPSSSYVELTDDTMTVRMGVGFRSTVPRRSIRAAEPYDGPVGGWGVHGWRGRWLVNGSATNLVDVHLDPPARGYMTGFPVTVKRLRLSMVDPEAFLSALGVDAPEPAPSDPAG